VRGGSARDGGGLGSRGTGWVGGSMACVWGGSWLSDQLEADGDATRRHRGGGGDSVTASHATVVRWWAGLLFLGGLMGGGRTDGTGALKEAAPSGKDRDLAGL
jgi:hypothetical protein